MAQTFNFATRQLTPYNDNWNRGGNAIISGALWYIKERDGLYLKAERQEGRRQCRRRTSFLDPVE